MDDGRDGRVEPLEIERSMAAEVHLLLVGVSTSALLLLLGLCVRLGDGVYIAVAINGGLSHVVSCLVPLCITSLATFLLLDLLGGLWAYRLALCSAACGL